MADYYSIIAKAVAALDPNTGEARRRLYERARGALNGETRHAELPLDKSDILAAQMSLEEAIARVEIEALRAEDSKEAAQRAPRPVAPVAKDGRGPLIRLWAQMFGGRPAERTEPRFAEPRLAEVPVPPSHSKGRDTWLTELLARASREEGEDEAIAPPPKIGRIR
jgi:G:T/U-mismatch repair DNA glycosylase